MPDAILEETVADAGRHAARITLALAYGSIILLLLIVTVLSVSSNRRADRASKSACTLVGVVDRQVKVIDGTVSLVLAPPGPERDRALSDLRTTVREDQAAASKVKRQQKC